MAESESEIDFKSLLEQKIVQPVNRKLKAEEDLRLQLEKKVATLRLCLWGAGVWCLINTVLAFVAIVKICK